MSTDKIVRFVLAATAASLVLAAASGASFARPIKPVYPPTKPLTAKMQPAKSTGAPTNSNKGFRPQ
ncbi:MAG TPA: hypothetical protein VJV58_19450 [Bradyrhizobium sp.]|uniref:hypothetical protein n=1 Tax=Bradyrhizobium sp. TaxID=376 RepID=UPI002B45E037|nr:hypothetical protein [Bradyrhizobium sp.]HKO73111.1 hypothetical protein [Bradyrhizobium sp.]